MLSCNEEVFIILELKDCTGCRGCELACSFRHKKNSFQPSASCIEIITEGDVFGVVFHTQSPYREECDGCHGFNEMLCIKFCPYCQTELLRAIESFLKNGERGQLYAR